MEPTNHRLPDSKFLRLLEAVEGEYVPEFRGKVRLTANPLDLIGADIDVSDGSLALIVSNQEVGDWPLHSVAVESAIDGFHVKVDGEEFIFSTRDADAFAAAIGISRFGSRGRKPGRSAQTVAAIKSSGLIQPPSPGPIRAPARSKGSTARPARSPAPKAVQVKPMRASKPAAAEAGRRAKSFFATREIFSARRLVGIALVMGLVALAIIAKPLLAGMLLLLGIGGALLAGATAVDPLLATRLPESWPASRVAISAVAMLATGVILVAF